MKTLSLEKIADILNKSSKMIIICAVAGLVLGVIYSFTIFQPVYKSTAKILIKDTRQENAVSNEYSNSVLTQMQILSSGKLANIVWQDIRKKYSIPLTDVEGTERMKSAIVVQNPFGTSVVSITASWNNPKISKDIAESFVNSYINLKIKSVKLKSDQVVSLIDNPLVPVVPSFPDRTAVCILFGIVGIMFGIISAFGRYLTKCTCDDIEQLEVASGVPVLGMIPWLDNNMYNDTDTLLVADNIASFYTLAYQKVVSSIRIRGSSHQSKVLAFTSSEFTKYRSTVLMNIAYTLNKSGQSVIVVDSDFRTPSIHNEFGLGAVDQFDLPKLINNINNDFSRGVDFDWRKIAYFIKEVHGCNKLHVITNNGNVSDPNAFIHSSAYPKIIQALKEKYDWVLIDTPPVMAVPDALAIGSNVDGVVLMTGLKVSKFVLSRICNIFSDYNLPMFGVIAREMQTQEAVISNRYLSQVISRMIPNEAKEFVTK